MCIYKKSKYSSLIRKNKYQTAFSDDNMSFLHYSYTSWNQYGLRGLRIGQHLFCILLNDKGGTLILFYGKMFAGSARKSVIYRPRIAHHHCKVMKMKKKTLTLYSQTDAHIQHTSHKAKTHTLTHTYTHSNRNSPQHVDQLNYVGVNPGLLKYRS